MTDDVRPSGAAPTAASSRIIGRGAKLTGPANTLVGAFAEQALPKSTHCDRQQWHLPAHLGTLIEVRRELRR